MTDTRPSFLVAGAARSGTTGMVEGLRAHPDVFVTEPKEPHYFALHKQGADFQGPGDDATINKVAVTDLDEYLGLYPEEPSYVARGDGSVSTLYYYEDAIPEIKRVNPDMRIIILLRDPVERAHSSHQYMRARGFEVIEDFRSAVEREPARIAANWHHIWHYTAMSRYADAVEAFQAEFPADQLEICFYDDLNANYEATLERVLQFIGAPESPGVVADIPRVNISGQPKYATLHKAIWWATKHEGVRKAVKGATSYRLRERIRRSTLQKDALDPDLYAALAPVFADDLERLRRLVPGPQPAWLSEGLIR